MADGDRNWWISYDVSNRRIVMSFTGDDEHEVTPDEAIALREELLAASIALNEHKYLYANEGPPEHNERGE